MRKTKEPSRIKQGQKTPPMGDLLKVETFAELLSWHPESVRRAIRAHRLNAVKVGKGWRIPRAEMDLVMERGLPSVKAA